MGDSSFLTVKDTRLCQQENTCNGVEGVLLVIKGRDYRSGWVTSPKA
jgi:hypothetical protein